MKEHWNKHRDTAIAVVFITFLAALAWHGGAALMSWVKFPFAVAIIAGLGFMIGNDGGHALKRFVRDVAWPWIRSRMPW